MSGRAQFRRVIKSVRQVLSDKDRRIVRNRIDYTLIKQRFRNAILSAKPYPGANICSDHNTTEVCFRKKLKVIRISKGRYKYVESEQNKTITIPYN